MKQFFTLLALLCTTTFFAQTDLSQLPEHVQQILDFDKQQRELISNQATIRNNFGIDSAYQYIYPSDEVNIRKYFTYNDIGLIMSSETIIFNPATNDWEYTVKSEIVRNADNLISQITNWEYGTSDWELDSKNLFTYDAQGNQIDEIDQNWNSSSQVFVNSSRLKDTFDLDNNRLQSDLFFWQNGDWSTTGRRLYNYDANNGLLLEEVREDFSVLNNSFTPFFKMTYAYDNNNLVNERVSESFDWNYGVWSNEQKEEFFYDNDGNLSSLYYYNWEETAATPDWVFDEFIAYTYSDGNKVEDFHRVYDVNSDTWNDTRKWVYFFSIATSIKTPLASTATVSCLFQNPIQTGEIISCQDLESNKDYQILLFDVSGRVLLEKTFTGESKIHLPKQMQRGVYFMNIKQEGKLVLNKKIIVAN